MNMRKFIEDMKAAGVSAERAFNSAAALYERKEVELAMKESFPDYSVPAEKRTEPAPIPVTAAAPAVNNGVDSGKRAVEILDLCTIGGCSERANEYVKSQKTVEEIRSEIIADRAKKTGPINDSIRINRDETDKFRDARIAALCLRNGMNANDLGESTVSAVRANRELQNYGLLDLAFDCIRSAGAGRSHMNNVDIAETILDPVKRRELGATSGDFPYIVGNVANKVALKAYLNAPTTYQMWCVIGELPDFKTSDLVNMSGFSTLTATLPGEPPKRLKMSDTREQVKLTTYHNTFVLDFQSLVNDDKNFFSRIIPGLSSAARRKVNALAYGILNANAVLADNVALFYATTHVNTGTTGAISDTTITELVKKLGLQTDPQGNKLNYTGRYFLVPKTKEGTALKYLANDIPYITDSSANASTYRGRFEVIADAELDGGSTTAYYLTADPSIADTVGVYFLNGKDAPTIREAENTIGSPLGINYEISLHAGAKALDYRGMAKNAGA